MGSPYTTISQVPEPRFLQICEGAEKLRGYEDNRELCRDYIRSCFPEREDLDAALKSLDWYRRSASDLAVCGFTKALVVEIFDKIRIDPDLIWSVWAAGEGKEYIDPPTQFAGALNRLSMQSPEDFETAALLKRLLLEGQCLPSSCDLRPYPFLQTDCMDVLLSPEDITLLQKASAPDGLISLVVEELALISPTEHRDLKQIGEMLLRIGPARTWLYAQAWAT